ncbi:hypothetical protein LCGC14_2697660 [marine sediment metagenome]|uniref:Uncharacterized protein n=1 Tax=marine sediment metagenome TaxID=412755 RepID=A0A0F9BR46_9ZZZZ
MPKINIDDLVEPIEVTVGGKMYTVADISPELANQMAKISTDAEKAEKAGKKPNPTDTTAMMVIMAKMLGAPEKEIAKLGMRKRLMLMRMVMGTINEEIEGKNDLKAVAAKLQQ